MIESNGRILFIMVLLITLSVSCEKNNTDPVLILTPFELYIVSEPEEILTFSLQYEGDLDARSLEISSKTADEFTRTELDSTVAGTSLNIEFEYKVPLVYEPVNIYMEFILELSDGTRLETGRVVEVIITEKKLEETAGHEMFSKASDNQNAYDLKLGTPLFSHLTDSNRMHIMDTTNTDTLLNRWLSPASAMFVRYNGFDYANATTRTVKDAFNSGLKFEFMNDIETGDIIITRFHDNTADTSYCVVKVTEVVDLPGKKSDKYVFNIKRAPED